jgi:four helix bundle protein
LALVEETATDGSRLPAQRFEDLLVWQRSHALVLDIYRMSQGFPRSEVYGLTAQLRRAAVSVPANIAEGFKKRGRADKARFMNIAEASLEEVRYYVILARDLGYLESDYLANGINEVAYLLGRYVGRILASPSSPSPSSSPSRSSP